MAIIILILLVVIIFLVFAFIAEREGKGRIGNLPKARDAKQGIITENRRKILTLFEAQDQVTNNDVEKALGVSDATATNYLQELEQENLIVQVRETGRGVYYEKRLK